jgi:hypothetical protein
MKNQIINEEFRKMQKLAGLLKEDNLDPKLKNLASKFIKQNFNPGEEEDHVTYEFEKKEIPSLILNFLENNERLDIKVKGQGAVIYLDGEMVIVEFNEGIYENQTTPDIISFLNQNKQELFSKLSKRFDWDEYDWEIYDEYEITMGGDSEGNSDPEIAGLGDGGLDFSFNPSKVKDEYGDASNFKLIIAGKPVYGISYSF